MRSLIAGAAALIALTGCDEPANTISTASILPDIDTHQRAIDAPHVTPETLSVAVDSLIADAPDVDAIDASALSGVESASADCDAVHIDFETDPLGDPIAAGQDLFLAYQSLGVQIVAMDSQSMGIRRKPIAFDSSAPTGGDRDLGTPSADFGGPGHGQGGGAGAAGENAFAQGNVMIIAENETDANGDGLVDVPDDEASGGWIIMLLGREYCVNSLTMIDIEAAETNEVIFYDRRRRPIFESAASGLGDNSVEVIEYDVCGVQEIWFYLDRSGAVDDIDLCLN
ncbi:MAG: hypothetical protein AAFV53_02650 [Myxococcota bacterium]